MASISVEEENYVRMSLLLTGISPRAVRTCFDNEFDPVCLDASLKKEHSKLSDLKKQHRITKSQWNLLFPRRPDVPDSKTFDVTLMTTLLRNLTPMKPPSCGFDCLPSATAMETTPASDLARLKYYRNHLCHLEDGKIDNTFFNIAWDDITNAIARLGGEQMKDECDHMKTKPLDQTNQEIMIEIRELKESFKNLKLTNSEMKKSHEFLQENHAVVTKEMEEIRISQKDVVPWNIRVRINQTLKEWKDYDDKMFINTRAAKYVLKCIQENGCVTITASSGVGKTTTLRHIALLMADEDYDVILVTEPSDIVRFYNPNTKSLFVVDNLCGNFSIDQSDIKSWEPIMQDLNQIIDKKQSKMIAACRLQVYQDKKFDSLSVFKSCVCNMLLDSICLSKTEKNTMAMLYLKAKPYEIDYGYDCFPLLCKLCHENSELNVSDFFRNPFSVYEAEIDKLFKIGLYAKYCALALCVIFNNKLNVDFLTEDIDEITKTIISNTCEACKLDRGTSRLVLQSELDLLTHTFIQKENNVYKTIHDKIFDFLAYYFGQKIIYCLIKNADIGLIKERFVLDKTDEVNQFVTVIPLKYHQIYIQRMIDDWSKGKVQGVFSNINMNIPLFRKKFLSFLKTLNISYQNELANTFDKRLAFTPTSILQFSYDDTYDTPLLHCCYIGDIALVNWCCNHGVDVNRCSFSGKSPIMVGCEQRHTEIVKMLLERRADCNECDQREQSLLMVSFEHGHTEMVKMLLDRGADYNTCDMFGESFVMKSCKHGHTEMLSVFLNKGADLNECDCQNKSLLTIACERGHIQIVKMLLERGANYIKRDSYDESCVMKSCRHGHTKILRMLLSKGVDVNECDWHGKSLVTIASEYNNNEIVNMLFDKGAICTKRDRSSRSPLMMACEYGDIATVKMMLNKEADYNECDWHGKSLVMIACGHGHTEIVNMLLQRGADCKTCDSWGQSPIMVACKHGHLEILKMLLNKTSDYNECDTYGKSLVAIACRHGHTEIVQMLLNNGADCNKCDENDTSPILNACHFGYSEIVKVLLDKGAICTNSDSSGRTPLMFACEHGQTEIVKMFLDRGADYTTCDSWKQSPLSLACKHGHINILKLILNKKSDYNECEWHGQSLVRIACIHGHTEIVKLLLGRGADYKTCDSSKQSSLMLACKHGHIKMMMFDKESDYKECDWHGKSLVKNVCGHGHSEIDKMLLGRGSDVYTCDGDD